ncbi:AraC family transcriptional regulator [Dyadobacter endophyticus]|nr:AraC family transcriptional regulator [Dyadobacter endophyticus]
MKAVFEHVRAGSGESLIYKRITLPVFDAPFHFHPEYEVTYIKSGSGMRYVGMGVEPFGPGDCVLLGPDLAHCWINHPEEDGRDVEAYVIQFNGELWNQNLTKWPEFEGVMRLLDFSKGGIVFHASQVEDLFGKFDEVAPAYRIPQLLNLLLRLSESPHRTLTATYAVYEDHQRFNLVFGYIINHFREQIELETVAELVGLTPTSFCRYFKKMTGKTLFDIVLHYRMEAAAQLLAATEHPINLVAFESGFESLSYFNRAFKKCKGSAPKMFRQKYRGKLKQPKTR